jgi:hypothetical protein
VSKFRKTIVGMVAAISLSGGLLVTTSQPAAAVPNLCTIASRNIDYAAGWAWTQCTGGDGWFRVRISCKPSPNSNWTYFYWGDWISAAEARNWGSWSQRSCPSENRYIVYAATEVG